MGDITNTDRFSYSLSDSEAGYGIHYTIARLHDHIQNSHTIVKTVPEAMHEGSTVDISRLRWEEFI